MKKPKALRHLNQKDEGRDGFTLIEIMMVVVIIGLLLTIIVPGVVQARGSSQNARLANDWRTFSSAFQTFTLENGTYPDEVAQSVIPTGMDDYLRSFKWTETTFVGGSWDWDYDSYGIMAGVSLVSSNLGMGQMQRLDDRFDDGDLSSGFFQKLGPTRFAMILEH